MTALIRGFQKERAVTDRAYSSEFPSFAKKLAIASVHFNAGSYPSVEYVVAWL